MSPNGTDDARPPLTFRQELFVQRWDDHRLYHRSRINQSLHLVSALCFIAAYALLFVSPPLAVFLGWFVAMVTRQTGHFFFEPKGYDETNQVTHERKEAIKVGYNLRRKIVLLSVWAAIPLGLWLDPTFGGLLPAPASTYDFVWNLSVLWLGLGFAAVLVRALFLAATRNVQTGAVWFTKILTDPFHDVMMYWRSPLHLLRGERLDPMTDVPPAIEGSLQQTV